MRTSGGEVGSSRHKPSNSSRELSSPPKPKGAGRLPEKTLGKAGGKPSGESEDACTACNNLSMCYKLMAEEHGFDLGVSEEPKVEVEEHVMSSFDLGESKESKM